MDRFLWGGGLDRFDRNTNKFIHYKYNPTGWSSHHIWSLYEDSEKTLWVGTTWALLNYDRENDQFIRPVLNEKDKTVFSNNTIFSIIEDEYIEKPLWISSIIEDKEKTLWVTTEAEGLIGISNDQNNFRYISKELSSPGLTSLCIDQSGIIWVGTKCQGINKIIPRKKYFNHYKYTLTDSTNLKLGRTYSFF